MIGVYRFGQKWQHRHYSGNFGHTYGYRPYLGL
ncbi:hypothetical protein BH160DRAFT_0083 [Burkholderia sp. H160]|nr:hypothetical protein BH160DRAFT_0083 [Burkholderia sp. H160]